MQRISDKKLISLIPDASIFISVILAYIVDRNFPLAEVIPQPGNFLGWCMIAAGVIFALWTISIIRSNNTTSNVTDVPPTLITHGLFARSRNPFYLSYITISVGIAFAFGSLGAFIAPVVCITLLQFIVRVEEKILHEKFGRKYEDYKRLTRRWI
jgi:protein-S-isoprenylcysteine O-methyltransferase Ste14